MNSKSSSLWTWGILWAIALSHCAAGFQPQFWMYIMSALTYFIRLLEHTTSHLLVWFIFGFVSYYKIIICVSFYKRKHEGKTLSVAVFMYCKEYTCMHITKCVPSNLCTTNFYHITHKESITHKNWKGRIHRQCMW